MKSYGTIDWKNKKMLKIEENGYGYSIKIRVFAEYANQSFNQLKPHMVKKLRELWEDQSKTQDMEISIEMDPKGVGILLPDKNGDYIIDTIVKFLY